MQMYPGAAGFKEHHYMVEKDDYMISEDFHFNKNSGMHSNKGDHLNYGGGGHNHNILHHHPMMRPVDHDKPNHILPMIRPIDHHNKPNHNLPMMRPIDHHNKQNHSLPMIRPVDHFGYNKHGGGGYAETFYEQQEEKQFYENSYGQFDRGAYNRRPATWDCKGIDD